MAKNKKNKKNTKETKNVNKNILSETEIEIIVDKTNEIINKLNDEKKGIFKSKKSKELIQNQINDFNRFLEEEQYYLLRDKISALEKLEEEENKSIKKEIELEKEKSPKKKFSFHKMIDSIKHFDRWPLYSRIKKISENYDGSEKWKRISLVLLVFFLLVAVMIIGILLITNVIPYDIYQDTTKIGPWIVFALPLAMLFFV